MKKIPFLGLGVQSGFPSVTAQSRVNCYLEKVTDDETTSIVAYGMPCLEYFTSLGASPIRGMLTFGDYIYAVASDDVYRVDSGGNLLSIGTITSTYGRVGMACNGSQILIVDGSTSGWLYDLFLPKTCTISNQTPTKISCTNHGLIDGSALTFATTGTLPSGLTAGTTYYVVSIDDPNSFNVALTRGGTPVNTSSAGSGVHTINAVLAKITAEGFPGGETAGFLDGYFVVNKPATGQYYVSGLYDGINWNALDFASAESNPDNIIALYVDHGEVILFGPYTTEFVQNVGAQDFPFGRAGAPAEVGLAARWTVCKMDSAIMFLGRNRMGEVQVYLLNGYSPQRVSNSDIERILNSYTSVSDATAFSFMTNGHPMYVLNIGGQTWMYDMQSGCWSQLKGYGLERYRGEVADVFGQTAVIADYENGNIYRLKDTVYADNGEPNVMSITGRHISSGLDRIRVYNLQADIEAGTGLSTGQGSDPEIMLEVSRDGGHSFGSPIIANMGALGQYRTRAQWARLGAARDFVFRLSISDPVKRCILAVYGDVE